MEFRKIGKKSEITWEVLLGAIIVLIILAISIYFLYKYMNQGGQKVDTVLSNMDDYDQDGITDFFDNCPCDYGEAQKCNTDRQQCIELINKKNNKK